MGSLVDTELFDKGKPLPGVEPKEAGLKGIITCHSANKSLDQVQLILVCGCAHNISVNCTTNQQKEQRTIQYCIHVFTVMSIC